MGSEIHIIELDDNDLEIIKITLEARLRLSMNKEWYDKINKTFQKINEVN